MSTLERGDEIEYDFYHLKAQEWACEPSEAKTQIHAAIKAIRGSGDVLSNQLLAVLEAGISDNVMKAINKQVEHIRCDIEDDVMYRLKDELAQNLVAWVTDMAKRTVQAILDGNENEMRRYLSCEQPTYWNGRSEADNPFTNPRKIEEWHSVIRGELHESGCIALRHAIVEAHADLLKSERIFDLEDQVKSLVAQVNKVKAEKDAMWERLGHLEERT